MSEAGAEDIVLAWLFGSCREVGHEIRSGYGAARQTRYDHRATILGF